MTKLIGWAGLTLGLPAVVLLAVACGTPKTVEKIASATATVTPRATYVAGAQMVPGFDLLDLDGQTWTLSEYRGQPVMRFVCATGWLFRSGSTLVEDGTGIKLYEG